MTKSLASILLCLLPLALMGQLSVAVTASTDTIKFGDEVHLSFRLNVPEGVEITEVDFGSLKNCINLVYDQLPEELDSLMDIDVLDGGPFKIDNHNLISSKEKVKGEIPRQGTIRVRVSSVGAFELPRPAIVHASGEEEMLLSSGLLFVKPIGTLEDLNPNWDIIEESSTWQDYLKYLYTLFGIIALVFLIYWLSRYFKKEKVEEVIEEKIEIIRPAHEVAIEDLNALKAQQLWQNGDTKGYHTELTRIMRQYIEDRYDIYALEMTSAQLKREMKTNGIQTAIITRFDDILMIADKVKFAKGSAGPEINQRFMDEAYGIVSETKNETNEEVEEK